MSNTTPATVAEGLTKAEIAALLQFSRDDETLRAENGDERLLAHRMMSKGLVSYIGMAGHVFMQLQPFGLAVRAHIQEQP